MIYAVVGGRDFNDYERLSKILNKLKITKIVSGGAKGADTLAAKYAKDHNIKLEVHYPDWDKYGKSAGYIRNEILVERSEAIIAFWNLSSPGTKHTIQIAKRAGKDVTVINYSNAEPLF